MRPLWYNAAVSHAAVFLELCCLSTLTIHIERYGRDVSMSTSKMGYIRPLWWRPLPKLMASGLYWEWMVDKGRRDGRKLRADYIEVRFEELVADPPRVLKKLGEFIE